MADFDALPEGEWVEVIGGMKWTFTYETRMKMDDERLVLRIPTSVQQKLGLKEGEELMVSFSNGALVARRPARRAARKRRAA